MTSEHLVLALSIIHSFDFITARHLYFSLSSNIVCYVLLYVRTRTVWRYQKSNHTGIVNRKRENLMTKRKQTKGQTMIYKTLHRQRKTLIINNSIKIRKRTQVLWESKQFVLHQWHPLCLLVLCICFIGFTSTHILLCYIFKNITWTTYNSSSSSGQQS